MTTIIIVVVVALVFFVALCVVTFMVWKREEEMRTDSLRSIEANLQELGYRMTGDFSRRRSRRKLAYDGDYDSIPYRDPRGSSADPFEWTRESVSEDGRSPGAAGEDADRGPSGTGRQVEQTELRAYEDVYAGEETHGSEHIEDLQAKEAQASEAPQGTEAPAGPEAQTGAEVPAAPAEPGAPEDVTASAAGGPAAPEAPAAQEVPAAPGAEEATGTLEAPGAFADAYGAYAANEIPFPEEPDPYRIAMDLEDLEALDDLESFEEYARQFDLEERDAEDVPNGSPEAAHAYGETGQGGMDGYVTEFAPEEMSPPREPMGHDVGRSGRKYTAEELDMLIRE